LLTMYRETKEKHGQCLTKGEIHGKFSARNLYRIHMRYISCRSGYMVAVVNGADQEGLARKKRSLALNAIFRAKMGFYYFL